MPYDIPDDANACASCEAIRGSALACDGCYCPDPEWMHYGLTLTWELGYHWKPAEWTCDLCGAREFVGHRDPIIDVPSGLTICDRDECLGAILRGLEAMRKGGLDIHAPGETYQLDGCEQGAKDFYQRLQLAGRAER